MFCFRLVSEEEKVCVYHNLDNARVYHGAQTQCIDVDPEVSKWILFLFSIQFSVKNSILLLKFET